MIKNYTSKVIALSLLSPSSALSTLLVKRQPPTMLAKILSLLPSLKNPTISSIRDRVRISQSKPALPLGESRKRVFSIRSGRGMEVNLPNFNLQPTLHRQLVRLHPLLEEDFEPLYNAEASS